MDRVGWYPQLSASFERTLVIWMVLSISLDSTERVCWEEEGWWEDGPPPQLDDDEPPLLPLDRLLDIGAGDGWWWHLHPPSYTGIERASVAPRNSK